MNKGKVIIIQGGQYGSEGKGQIAAQISSIRGAGAIVRTGSINAGHTVYHKGKPYAMQIIPTGWVNPDMDIILGAGIYIHPDILERELRILAEHGVDVSERLKIDYRAAMIGHEDAEKSESANRHHKIGATGKGSSEAMIRKMRSRGSDDVLFARSAIWRESRFQELGIRASSFHDTARLIDGHLLNGRNVVLEGTQGSLLDFNLGQWPYVTSRMCNSAAWLAEAGIAPTHEIEVILVCRTMPIRVAGNSGSLPRETTWPKLARDLLNRCLCMNVPAPPTIDIKSLAEFEEALNYIIDRHFPEVRKRFGSDATDWSRYTPRDRENFKEFISEANAMAIKLMEEMGKKVPPFFEKTTVTRKLRRIANLSFTDLSDAIMWNNPTELIFTFFNYIIPQVWEKSIDQIEYEDARQMVSSILELELQLHRKISYVTTGPLMEHLIKTEDLENLVKQIENES